MAPLIQPIPESQPLAVISPLPAATTLFDVGLKVEDALHHVTRGQGAQPGAPGLLAGFLRRWIFAFPGAVGAAVALGTWDIGAGAAAALVGIMTLPITLDGLERADRLYTFFPVKPTAAKLLAMEHAEGGSSTKALLARLAQRWVRRLEIWKIEAPELRKKLEDVAATNVALTPEAEKRVERVASLLDAIPTNGWSIVIPSTVLRDFNALDPEDQKALAPILLERLFSGTRFRGFTTQDDDLQTLFTVLYTTAKRGP